MMSFFNWYFDFKIVNVDTNGIYFKFTLADTKTLYNQLGEPFHFKWSLQISLAKITYNIPMTLSAVIALIVVQSKKRLDYILIINVTVLLLILHFVTIYFMALSGVTGVAQSNGLMKAYLQEHTMLFDNYTYFVKFLMGYGIRFEPFLMMVYVWSWVRK